MTAERFGELLRRPLLLSSQNATELEELIADYPWSGPLRRLRYQKALLDGDPSEIAYWRARAEPFQAPGMEDGSLEAAAGHPHVRAERHFGFGSEADDAASVPAEVTVSGSEPSPSTLTDDAQGDSPGVEGGATDRPDIGAQSAAVSPDEATSSHSGVGAAQEPFVETQRDGLTFRSEVSAAASAVEVAEWYLQRNGLTMDYGRPQPAHIEALRSYREWKQRRSQASWQELLMLGLEGPPSGKTRKSKRRAEPQEPEVASETLADLLASQGHHEKALRMYEQLALRYPTKRDNFAARIQALQHASH